MADTKLQVFVAGFLGPDIEIVVAPPAVHRLVAFQVADLQAKQFGNLRTPLGIVVAVVHPHEGLNGISVSPDVVQSRLIGAAEMRQRLEQPLLTAINGRCHVTALRFQLQQRCQAQRGSARSECVVRPGNRGKDVQVLRTFRTPPGTVGILIRQQERHATIHGLLEVGLFRHLHCRKSRRDQETIGLFGGTCVPRHCKGNEQQKPVFHGCPPAGFCKRISSPALSPSKTSALSLVRLPKVTGRFSCLPSPAVTYTTSLPSVSGKTVANGTTSACGLSYATE